MIPRRDVTDDTERHPARIIEEVSTERRHGILMGARDRAEIAEPLGQTSELRGHLAPGTADLVDLNGDKVAKTCGQKLGGAMHDVAADCARRHRPDAAGARCRVDCKLNVVRTAFRDMGDGAAVFGILDRDRPPCRARPEPAVDVDLEWSAVIEHDDVLLRWTG
jgi:hypothetical protein